MKFSILTPSYNYAQFLPTALASVAGQTGPPEHIVMDGGSTDGTVELLHSAPVNVAWRSEPDLGQSDALNKALGLSTGDIIGWLNADDYYLGGAIDAVAAVFEANPQIDVVYGDCVFVDEVERVVRLGAGYNRPSRVLRSRGCIIPSTSTFVRRRAIDGAPWDKHLRVVMDWDFFLGLDHTGRQFRHVPTPLACFRLHGLQVTHDLSDRDSSEHERVRARWGAYPEHPGFARLLGDLEHRCRKIATGALSRELRAKRSIGMVVGPCDAWPPN